VRRPPPARPAAVDHLHRRRALGPGPADPESPRHSAPPGRGWPGWSGGGAGAPSGAAAFARGQLGKPYVWGASGPGSYDCSGLVMTAYRRAGVWLPRGGAMVEAPYSGARVRISSIGRCDCIGAVRPTG
jgi:cell wall-associated NlpC family hydrolase